jgi:hypothetical protein
MGEGMETGHEIAMVERIARLEERLVASDKALELAREEIKSNWAHVLSVISLFVSVLVLIFSVFRK